MLPAEAVLVPLDLLIVVIPLMGEAPTAVVTLGPLVFSSQI